MKKSNNLKIWFLIVNIFIILGFVVFITNKSEMIQIAGGFGFIIIGGVITFFKVKCPHCGKVIGGIRGWTGYCPFCKRNLEQ